MSFVTEVIYDRKTKYFSSEHDITCSKYDEEYPNRINKEYSFVRFINYKKLVVIYEFDSRRIPGALHHIPGMRVGHASAITRWKYKYLIFENISQALITIECDNKGDHAGEGTAIELTLPKNSAHLAKHFIEIFDEFYLYKCTSWDGLTTSINLDKSQLIISIHEELL